MKKSVVLLSGGLDSSVNLFVAKRESNVSLAITFDYGQRAAAREIWSGREQCRRLGIPHRVIKLEFFDDIGGSSLIDRTSKIPVDVDINDSSATVASAKAVWVPNRNGIFLNIAAGFAETLNADFVVAGFNREEAQTFTDNTQAFLETLSAAFVYSTSTGVKATSYTTNMDKREIVNLGRALGVDFELIWPCYFGDERPCGKCESCLRFRRARE